MFGADELEHLRLIALGLQQQCPQPVGQHLGFLAQMDAMTQQRVQRGGRLQLRPQLAVAAGRAHQHGGPLTNALKERIVRGRVAGMQCNDDVDRSPVGRHGARIPAPFGICPDPCNTRRGTPINDTRDGGTARSCTRCDLSNFTSLQDVALLEAQSGQAMTLGQSVAKCHQVGTALDAHHLHLQAQRMCQMVVQRKGEITLAGTIVTDAQWRLPCPSHPVGQRVVLPGLGHDLDELVDLPPLAGHGRHQCAGPAHDAQVHQIGPADVHRVASLPVVISQVAPAILIREAVMAA